MMPLLLLPLVACTPDPPGTPPKDPTITTVPAADDSGAPTDDSTATAPDDTGPTTTDDSDTTPSDDSAVTDDSALTDDSATDDTGAGPDAATLASDAIVQAALAFRASLDVAQLAAASYTLDDPERQTWSNLPAGVDPRQGPAVGDMTTEQRALLDALLAASLSAVGAERADAIRRIEGYHEADGNAILDDDYYYVTFFGEPSMDEPWGWQYDGHHVALSFTAWGGAVTMTPAFWGVQPTLWEGGADDGLRVMGPHEDAAFALMASLDADQLVTVMLDEPFPTDVIAGPGNDGSYADYEGLLAADMDATQQALLLDLVAVWLLDQDDAHALLRLAEVEAELDQMAFGWIGETTPGSQVYFRVRGPTVHIEYDMPDPDHVHSIYRDPTNDYGATILADHYAASPH